MITIQLTWIGIFAVLGCTFVGSLFGVGILILIQQRWLLDDFPERWYFILIGCALIGAILGWVFVV